MFDYACLNCCLDARKCLGLSDINKALESLKRSRSKCLGLAEVPTVKWEDVGGLEEAKQELLQE